MGIFQLQESNPGPHLPGLIDKTGKMRYDTIVFSIIPQRYISEVNLCTINIGSFL